MAKSLSSLSVLSDTLSEYGLLCFGGLELTANECALGHEAFVGNKALLIGNAGRDMWNVFSHSEEYADKNPNPMNRWTKRILDKIAGEIGARTVYPFDEPYWPFQKLAQKAVGVQPSPLGILIHPQYGLWHAFRGLIILDEVQEFTSQIRALTKHREIMIHPCDTCKDKPCLSACPVDAFTGARLDVKNCFEHLDTHDEPYCMMLGCQARCACPIAKEHHYDDAQIQFHMKSYRGN